VGAAVQNGVGHKLGQEEHHITVDRRGKKRLAGRQFRPRIHCGALPPGDAEAHDAAIVPRAGCGLEATAGHRT
jgi:hypothetical protein